MGGLGCGFSVLAGLFAIVGMLPLLGWLNWITTLPLALLAILFSALGLTPERRSTVAALGLAAGVLTFCWAVFRLSIGGGVI